jgi:hypothetical protein
MNERIWDLFKQSGIDIGEDQEGNIEKFAELIIKECRAAINTEDTFLIAGPCDRLICERFGIENRMMTPEFKPLAQKLLQAKLDHHLEELEDVFTVIGQHQGALAITQFDEIGEFLKEITTCGIIPEAKKVAEKYGLELLLGYTPEAAVL